MINPNIEKFTEEMEQLPLTVLRILNDKREAALAQQIEAKKQREQRAALIHYQYNLVKDKVVENEDKFRSYHTNLATNTTQELLRAMLNDMDVFIESGTYGVTYEQLYQKILNG